MAHVYCPCGKCPVRPMRTGQVPPCLDDGGSTESVLGLLFQGRDLSGDGLRELAVEARLLDGRPADPRDEWSDWLAAGIAADERLLALQVEHEIPTWETERRLRQRREMAQVAADAPPTWIGDRRA